MSVNSDGILITREVSWLELLRLGVASPQQSFVCGPLPITGTNDSYRELGLFAGRYQ
jgi:hypothetical protein